jgi:hypothetical protein
VYDKEAAMGARDTLSELKRLLGMQKGLYMQLKGLNMKEEAERQDVEVGKAAKSMIDW